MIMGNKILFLVIYFAFWILLFLPVRDIDGRIMNWDEVKLNWVFRTILIPSGAKSIHSLEEKVHILGKDFIDHWEKRSRSCYGVLNVCDPDVESYEAQKMIYGK